MNKKEVAQLCTMIRKTTNAWRNESDDEFFETVNIWYGMLKDEPYEIAQQALNDYLRRNTYPPTVADIYKPYKEKLEKQDELRREYNNTYYTAISFYPCYEDTAEVRREFDRITGNSVSKAGRLQTKISEYVRGQELADEYIPPIIEWLKGIEEIE